LTDVPQTNPFYLTSSPYRAPAIVLWVGALVIGVGAPVITYFLGVPVTSFEPMLVSLLGFGLVMGCGSIAGKTLSNARSILWCTVIAVLALSTWIAYDTIQTRYQQDRADERLAAELNALCREEGGTNLSDPSCARYSRVFWRYHYADGNPPPIN
jgi:hypothetical protein